MTLDQLQSMYAAAELAAVNILPNASSAGEWVLLVKDKQGKSHFLVAGDEKVQSFSSIDAASVVVREIGFKRAKLFL
ncbi:hypothetical protein OLMES_5135 [Oleiphilus messinensis]|uniref:Uncharacterized protein n=1 Tax=Oleiphilus messinensis TaxID=141451 RepID=A0A1Y0IG66_9GAMM|nr:hypothetical protein [Oleiphilus messinensis]ARU59119.1 hypothetical protein OLMES_5135 [Oleiphilus messinensis]